MDIESLATREQFDTRAGLRGLFSMPYWRLLGLRAQRAAVGLGFAASLAALAIPANSAWATNAAAVAPPRPTVHAPRLNEGEAPVIDGDISDAAWAKAAVLDTFFQEEPASSWSCCAFAWASACCFCALS